MRVKASTAHQPGSGCGMSIGSRTRIVGTTDQGVRNRRVGSSGGQFPANAAGPVILDEAATGDSPEGAGQQQSFSYSFRPFFPTRNDVAGGAILSRLARHRFRQGQRYSPVQLFPSRQKTEQCAEAERTRVHRLLQAQVRVLPKRALSQKPREKFLSVTNRQRRFGCSTFFGRYPI